MLNSVSIVETNQLHSVCITSIVRLVSLKKISDSTDPTCMFHGIHLKITSANSIAPSYRRQRRRSLMVRHRM